MKVRLSDRHCLTKANKDMAGILSQLQTNNRLQVFPVGIFAQVKTMHLISCPDKCRQVSLIGCNDTLLCFCYGCSDQQRGSERLRRTTQRFSIDFQMLPVSTQLNTTCLLSFPLCEFGNKKGTTLLHCFKYLPDQTRVCMVLSRSYQ